MRVKIKRIKQFCNHCKNQRLFKIKKKWFINSYCFKCCMCGKKIEYPHRFGKIQEIMLKGVK